MQGYIHSRGYLPHVEGASIQFITYRLAESIPKDMLSQVVKYKDSNIRKARIEELLDGFWILDSGFWILDRVLVC